MPYNFWKPQDTENFNNERFVQNFTDIEQRDTEIQTDINTRSPRATTLAGYGITDAYTVIQIDGKLLGVQAQLDEVETIARGARRAWVFDTRAALDAWLAVPANVAQLQIGDNLYIRATDTPDFWWDGSQKQPLETEKVDLSNFYTKAQIDTLLSFFLRKDNTTAFTPTGAYHPATKKYVDDSVSSAGGGDMLKSVYDPTNRSQNIFSLLDSLTAVANAAQSTANAAASAASTAQTTADGKAPISHAVSATTYGEATSANYGHARLSGALDALTANIISGVALEQKHYGAATAVNLNTAAYGYPGEWTFYNVSTATGFPAGETWTGTTNASCLKVIRFYSTSAHVQILWKQGTNRMWIRVKTSATQAAEWDELTRKSEVADLVPSGVGTFEKLQRGLLP